MSSARAQAQQVLKTLSNSRHTREEAIRLFGSRLREDRGLFSSLWTLSGSRHVCHCRLTQACHADAIIGQFHSLFPTAYDRTTSCPPSARVLAYLLKLREEPPSDGGSSADEGAPPAWAGWRGTGSPMMKGSGYTSRESCWVPHARKYPDSPCWKTISSLFMAVARTVGTTSLQMELASGRVEKSPFGEEKVSALREAAVRGAKNSGHTLKTSPTDRSTSDS